MTRVRRTLARLAIVAVVASGLSVASLATTVPTAEALSPSDFNPGFIISDAVFFNSGTMTPDAIQNFLNSQVPSCAASNGYPCLKNFRQNTQSIPDQGSGHCSAYAGGTNESAATIIYKSAIACRINPQVLIVLLEKEQGLVTDTSPSGWSYSAATGFSCPDTAPCDPNYATFFNQVYSAAWQFRSYTLNPNAWNYTVGANSILYNPDARCGRSTVQIANQATANLYNYTPYQPNAATLAWKLGNGGGVSSLYPGCGAFGNVNFFKIFANWFGLPTGNPNASLDSMAPAFGGVRVTGWTIDPATTASAYIWVNVDGVGGPYLANKPLAWFNALKPGFGPNHGFDVVVPASAGSHSVCVYQVTTAGSPPLGCKVITVPVGAGSFDSATAVPGGITITGWTVNYSTASPASVTATINGKATSYIANTPLAWFNDGFPGAGNNHGFNVTIRQPKGTYQVCLNDITGSLGCKSVTVSVMDAGSFDSVGGVVGGVRLKGWSVDLNTVNPSYIWVNVDGRGGPYIANASTPWIEGLFPSAGTNHGFDLTIPAAPGPHTVCVFGTNSRPLGCKTATSLGRSVGAFDAATGVVGGIKVSGWSADLMTKDPSYIWVNVDGAGGPAIANGSLPWFEGLYPGAGTNHGFNVTMPASPGVHTVCVFGTENKALGCKTVTVPVPAAGAFDSATAVKGGVRVTGWSVDLTTKNPSYIWVNVDGAGGPYIAGTAVPWFEGLYPGQGVNHGFDVTIPTSPGTHSVCVYGTNSTSLGCKSVKVG